MTFFNGDKRHFTMRVCFNRQIVTDLLDTIFFISKNHLQQKLKL